MAPIKFEDNIREKLEGREIEPSSEAWKKLSERLDNTSKKKNISFIWYAIAASIIGGLIAVSVFSNKGDKLNENATDFVDVNASEREVLQENVPKLVDNNSVETKSDKNNRTTLISEDSKAVTYKKEKSPVTEKSLPKKKNMILKSKENEASEAIAKNVDQNQASKLSQVKEEIIRNDDLLIDKQIDDLIAQGLQLDQNHTAVSAEEINTLLTNAEYKIQADKAIGSKKIDPMALLGDVEVEMENTFREKVFTALGDGYDIIKTAVVNRNN